MEVYTGVANGEMFKEAKNWQTAIGYVMRSGGMPSGHMASFSAMTTVLGGVFGWGSGVFALALGCWIIILYDATHVRYAVGVQGEKLNELLVKAGKKTVPLVEGHTMGQAVVGVIIGVIVGVVMILLMQSGRI